MPVRSEVRVILEILGRLAREINATVYLFGSYARGDHTLESDVDIVVVCECFKDMNYPDRVAFVRTKLPPDIGFNIVALTPEEFKSRCNKAFFKNISKYWIEIKPYFNSLLCSKRELISFFNLIYVGTGFKFSLDQAYSELHGVHECSNPWWK